MKHKVNEANYNLSISDLNTTDGDALSQILAMASQADGEEVVQDTEEVITNDPYETEFETELDNNIDTPFDTVDLEPSIDDTEVETNIDMSDIENYDNSIGNDSENYEFNIDDYKQYGIDENDFNEPEDYNEKLQTTSTTLVNEADDNQKGYSIIVKGKSYGFLPTNNEYSDEEIKNQFLKQYISEKGEEFPYAEEITIVKKDNVDEDLLISKNEEIKEADEFEEMDLDSFEYMYDTLINGNISSYKEKLNNLSKKDFADYIKWADTMGINKDELRLDYITEDDNGAEEFEDNEHLQIDEANKKYKDEIEFTVTLSDFGAETFDNFEDAKEYFDENKDKVEQFYKKTWTWDDGDYVEDDVEVFYDSSDYDDLKDDEVIESNDFEKTALNGEEYTNATLEEQMNLALFNAGVLNKLPTKKIKESNYSPKLKDIKKKRPNQANYQDVNIDADSKAGTLGFEDNANPSQPVRSQQNKPAKIVETAKHLLSKVTTDKKEKLQTRFIYKLMNEGVSYSKAKEIITKIK